MAYFFKEESKTFSEFLLVPSLTTKECTPSNVSLETPLLKYKKGEKPVNLKIPVVSAIMQSVSNDELAIALATEGGLSFIFCSQSIENQAEMVKKVKAYKRGFVESDSNVSVNNTISDVYEILNKTGHTTMMVTEDGTSKGKLLGIITSRDYSSPKLDKNTKVKDIMTSFDKIIYAEVGVTLEEAYDTIWHEKLSCLPIVDKNQNLSYVVFRKDNLEEENVNEVLDVENNLLVGAGINTHDYEERIPALVEAGADVLCLDSSDGFSEWQADTIKFVRDNYGDKVKIGAGNVVDKDGFLYLAKAGADFIKVGIGGGSICITREQKGIGRGQASALIDVVAARNEYFEETGVYVPLCSDGGIAQDYHVTLAIAMGSDFVMMGRYFARFDESPGLKYKLNGNYVKEYWGEGSSRARNWQRYGSDATKKMQFEEGVDSYVPYAGRLKENLHITTSKIKSTMCNCGCLSIPEFQKNAKITAISPMSLVEGSAHDVIVKDKSI